MTKRMRTERKWHEDFIQYCEDIVGHKNFEGFPVTRNRDGTIGWVKTKGSKLGQERLKWWAEKGESLGIPITGKWISVVVKHIHPFEKKPCQICGRVLSIRYVYPNKTTIKSINKHTSLEFDYHDFKTIFEIAEEIEGRQGSEGLQKLAKALKLKWNGKDGLSGIAQIIQDKLVVTESGRLSPGAMSNAPDRLDGYHTYNICCRSKEDTGRHADNMATYNQDRRAYEQWAEGNLKVASKMMTQGSGNGTCAMCKESKKMSADHIGPISLGFAHRHDGFQPLCGSCQGGKRDRLFKRDMDILIQQENEGSQVVSWHAEGLWNALKNHVQTDKEGEQLSISMKRNQWAYLTLLHQIYSSGHGLHLLPYLDPEQFHFDVKFIGIKPGLYQCDDFVLKPGKKDQYTNNAGRYLRVSFDALDDYTSKENRRILSVRNSDIETAFTELTIALTESKVFPQDIVKQFELARKESDKNHRSRLMGEAWNKWDGLGRPVDETVQGAIRSFMKAVWDQLITEW